MIDKKKIIAHLVAIAIGVILGLWLSHCTRGKVEPVKVERDTVVVYDTVPDYMPAPKDSVVTRYTTRYLPVHSTDTVDRYIVHNVTDTVAVEVPIMSKHYGNEQYDAWISGYEANLDSIKVYQKETLITETITKMKPPNKWELDLLGGVDYNTANKIYTPFAGGELLYKPSRWQFGARAVVSKTSNTGKVEPTVEGVVKYRLF